MTRTEEQLIQSAIRHLERCEYVKSKGPAVQETMKQLIDIDITCMWYLTQE